MTHPNITHLASKERETSKKESHLDWKEASHRRRGDVLWEGGIMSPVRDGGVASPVREGGVTSPALQDGDDSKTAHGARRCAD